MRLLPTTHSESQRHAETSRRETEELSVPRRIATGAEGGLVATLVMTAYRLPISQSLPPTALFWAKFVTGGEASDHPIAGLLLHLLYGVGGGVTFGVLSSVLSESASSDTARREEVGLLSAVGYGLALSAFGERVVLEGLLGLDPDADERLVFHVSHVVYALTLGTWFGPRTGDNQ